MASYGNSRLLRQMQCKRLDEEDYKQYLFCTRGIVGRPYEGFRLGGFPTGKTLRRPHGSKQMVRKTDTNHALSDFSAYSRKIGKTGAGTCKSLKPFAVLVT